MMCLIHGYGLSGSGSNLWTRSVAEALCYNGQAFQLMCQEPEPSSLDFVSEAYTYDAEGNVTQLFKRDVPYDGRCILHRPKLDLLPVYVHPPKGSTYMEAIPNLDEDAIETYLRRNESVLYRIVKDQGVAAMHVNHVVLMSLVAQRVSNRTGTPYAIMPHGSAIEYVVKKDPRMQKLAAGALSNASRIFVLGNEIRRRLTHIFPEVPNIEGRMRTLRVGANARQFKLVDRDERPQAIVELKQEVADLPRGKAQRHSDQLVQVLSDGISKGDLLQQLQSAGNYPAKRPDANLEEKLDRVDWTNEYTLAFVGRLIGYKGIPSVIAAFPEILRAEPNTRLVLAGRGPLRESMEALVWALANGMRKLAMNIASWGSALEGEAEEPFAAVEAFFADLETEDRLDEYFSSAEENLTAEHVIFTGYMDHEALRHLYPCCDVTIFPSVVAEGSPLVIPESMASGCFPLGTDHSGMRDSLETAGINIPENHAQLMKLRPDPQYTVKDIIRQVPAALSLDGKYRHTLRETAIEHFSWSRIAETLTHELTAIAGQA